MQISLFSSSSAQRPPATLVPRARPRAGTPLRVVHVIDGAGGGRGASGRLVISGRMADVCAELDRLAALEGH